MIGATSKGHPAPRRVDGEIDHGAHDRTGHEREVDARRLRRANCERRFAGWRASANRFGDEGQEMTHWFHLRVRRVSPAAAVSTFSPRQRNPSDDCDTLDRKVKAGVQFHRLPRCNTAETRGHRPRRLPAVQGADREGQLRVSRCSITRDGRFSPSGYVSSMRRRLFEPADITSARAALLTGAERRRPGGNPERHRASAGLSLSPRPAHTRQRRRRRRVPGRGPGPVRRGRCGSASRGLRSRATRSVPSNGSGETRTMPPPSPAI